MLLLLLQQEPVLKKKINGIISVGGEGERAALKCSSISADFFHGGLLLQRRTVKGQQKAENDAHLSPKGKQQRWNSVRKDGQTEVEPLYLQTQSLHRMRSNCQKVI